MVRLNHVKRSARYPRFWLLIFAVFFILGCKDRPAPPAAQPVDIGNNPAYGSYRFHQTKGEITVGMQPMASVINIVSECMKRDAILNGVLASKNSRIRFYPFYKGNDMNQFLRTGDLDVVMAGDMPSIMAAASSNATVAMMLAEAFNSVISKRHLLVSELKGKRVGYSYGSNAHYTLLQALSASGLRPDDLTLVGMEAGDMPVALENGQIDAYSAWEPIPTISMNHFKGHHSIQKGLVSAHVYLADSFVNSSAEAARDIVAAELRALNWINRSKKNLETACLWTIETNERFSGKKPVFSAGECVSVFDNFLARGGYTSVIPATYLAPGGRIHDEYSFLSERKLVPASSTIENVMRRFDNSLILSVLSGRDRYMLESFEYMREPIDQPDSPAIAHGKNKP